MNPRLSTLLLALLLPSGASFSQTVKPTPTPIHYTYKQLKENLTQFIRDKVGSDNVKGLSIALVDGDEVVWTAGFGTADESRQLAASADTRYALGGVSRLFTAAEVLRLAERKKVSLDSPLSQLIRGFSIHNRFKKTKPITLRTLLGDHSGLPGFFLKGIWVEEPESLSNLVGDLKSDYLYDPPGSHYRYSYVNYDLMGRVVELKRKKPFAEAMKRDLFEPLGMASSDFEPPVASGNTARGYIDGNAFPPKGQGQRLRDVPAAGMMSTANDMAGFIRFLFGGDPEGDSPLKTSSIEAFLSPGSAVQPLDFGHEVGNGWNFNGLSIEGAERVLWCDGTYPGYFSQVVLLPGEKLGFVILSNSSEAAKISDELSQRALKLALQVKKGLKADLKKKKIEMPKTVEVPEEILKSYSGNYSALGQVIRITPKEKCLATEFQGHQADLLPIARDVFVPHLMILIFPIDLPQYPLSFTSAGKMEVFLLGGLHFPVPFQKIAPVEIPEAWKDREGDYVLENSDGQMEFSKISLTLKNDFLTVVLKVALPALNMKSQEFKIALLPQSDEDAVVPGLFYGDGGTLHAVEDEEGDTRIYYSGYWFKKTRPEGGTPVVTPVPRPLAPKEKPVAAPAMKRTSETPALTPAKPNPRPRS